ncbi:gamma-glutamylcyclotransferase family protein [Phreatobacter stygius]|uniref:Gamma-glutamylcyclotransferase n=1 Tax=Phreatobacter stygius TaxID=1940610 RepID=A0A4D7BK21_9HYPH|nr:gamma-glutamylcyclotransferase family protein [Phreatobacter stygius]QCI68102.1 gamma-glutamylcyclotransferase [Phreatobacter stygius]
MLYFAYGSNMHEADMARRCPGARVCGVARLDHHLIFINSEGYVAVGGTPGRSVHGVVWRLTARHVAVLDRYECVDRGLYRKRMLPVRLNGQTVMALVYAAGAIAEGQRPLSDHFRRAVRASALAWNLPPVYIARLDRLARNGFRR